MNGHPKIVAASDSSSKCEVVFVIELVVLFSKCRIAMKSYTALLNRVIETLLNKGGRMLRLTCLCLLTVLSIVVTAICGAADSTPDPDLKQIVIIRHGEKPENGDNLSCQGINRSLQLPKVLFNKFQVPHHTYVPKLDTGKSTSHARMFQTVTPFAAKYNLKINSTFDENDVAGAAADVLKKKGTILMVWKHSNIPPLAQALGIDNPPAWDKHDFDSIWIIKFKDGKAQLTQDQENIKPSEDCPF